MAEGEREREKEEGGESRKRLTSPVIMVVGNGGSSLVYAAPRKVVAAGTGVADGVNVDSGKWPALKAIPGEVRCALPLENHPQLRTIRSRGFCKSAT